MTVTAIKKLFPGQPGTKRPLSQYGASLAGARYRCNEGVNITLKSVELIFKKLSRQRRIPGIPNNRCAHIRIDYEEVEPRKILRIPAATPKMRRWC